MERHSPSTCHLMILTLRSLIVHQNLRDFVRSYDIDFVSKKPTKIQPDPLRTELSFLTLARHSGMSVQRMLKRINLGSRVLSKYLLQLNYFLLDITNLVAVR